MASPEEAPAASVEGRLALGDRSGAAVRRGGAPAALLALAPQGLGPCHARSRWTRSSSNSSCGPVRGSRPRTPHDHPPHGSSPTGSRTRIPRVSVEVSPRADHRTGQPRARPDHATRERRSRASTAPARLHPRRVGAHDPQSTEDAPDSGSHERACQGMHAHERLRVQAPLGAGRLSVARRDYRL